MRRIKGIFLYVGGKKKEGRISGFGNNFHPLFRGMKSVKQSIFALVCAFFNLFVNIYKRGFAKIQMN